MGGGGQDENGNVGDVLTTIPILYRRGVLPRGTLGRACMYSNDGPKDLKKNYLQGLIAHRVLGQFLSFSADTEHLLYVRLIIYFILFLLDQSCPKLKSGDLAGSVLFWILQK